MTPWGGGRPLHRLLPDTHLGAGCARILRTAVRGARSNPLPHYNERDDLGEEHHGHTAGLGGRLRNHETKAGRADPGTSDELSRTLHYRSATDERPAGHRNPEPELPDSRYCLTGQTK